MTDDLPADATLHSLFAQAVGRTPHATALRTATQAVSFAELDARANGIAHAIATALPPDPAVAHAPAIPCVGLNLSRSIDAIAAMLGILKAGAAWVPLDPAYPGDRLRHMLADCGAQVVLQSAGQAAAGAGLHASDGTLDLAGLTRHGAPAPHLLAIDRIDPASAPPDTPDAGGEAIAYVVYTSGSTGRPKGVPGTHRAMLSRFAWMWSAFPFQPGELTCTKTALNFVDSVWETFGGLLAGVPAYVVDDPTARDPAALLDLLAREPISRLVVVPSLLAALADLAAARSINLPALRYLTCSGEPLPTALARQAAALAPQAVLLNLYGSSEMAADATCCVVGASHLDGAVTPIGQPIGRMRTYVLDETLAPVPAGEPGELCVSGPGLSPGYLGLPNLTAEKFLPNPWADGDPAHGTLFRSGDLAAIRPDGNLGYLGRRDFQIKLRGFRIEPGEIETVLARHLAIHGCAVAALETAAGRQLAAFYEVRPGHDAAATPAALRAHLAGQLADYLVPSRYFRLTALPRLPNGKLDRHRLTPPDALAPASGRPVPDTEPERTLLAAWQAVLGPDAVIGLDDDFFTIGGDSIRAAGVAVRARQAGYHLTPRDLYQHPTLAELARHANQAPPRPAPQAPPSGDVPLSPMQRYYFSWAQPNPNQFNVGFIARTSQRLDTGRLREALRHVVAHHPALRLRFAPDGQGGWRQWHADQAQVYDIPIHNITLPTGSPQDQLKAIQDSVERLHGTLDIETGPVMTAALFEDPAGRAHHLFLTQHELVTDALSLHITLEDLRSAYLALSAGQPPALPAPTLPYHDWVTRVMDYAHSPQAIAQYDYWLEQARDAQPFPEDNPASDALQRDITAHAFDVFDAATLATLRDRLGGGVQAALIHAIVAALAVVAHERSGQRSLIFHKVAHGRETCIADADVSRTVGWFITHTPITVRLEHDPTDGPHALPATLAAVARQYRAIPDNGLAHSALRYYSDDPRAQALAEQDSVRTLFQYIGDVWEDNYDGTLFHPTAPALMDLPDSVAPGNHADYHLHVYAQLMDGCLRMKLFYSQPNYRADSIEQMAGSFTRAMRGLLEVGG